MNIYKAYLFKNISSKVEDNGKNDGSVFTVDKIEYTQRLELLRPLIGISIEAEDTIVAGQRLMLDIIPLLEERDNERYIPIFRHKMNEATLEMIENIEEGN